MFGFLVILCSYKILSLGCNNHNTVVSHAGEVCCLWCRTRTSLQWSSQWAPQTLGAGCGLLVDIYANIFWAPLYFWYVRTQEVIIGLLSGTHQTPHSWGLAGILLNGVLEVHIYLCHSWNCEYWVICSINTLQVLPFLSILLKFWSLSCMFWYGKDMDYFTICTFENGTYSS